MASASLAGLSGVALLRDPALNKGTAFTDIERDKLGLRGCCRRTWQSQDEQEGRVLENLRKLREPLNRYVLLGALQDRNETLFYRVLIDHIDEMMPIIYTPTVGQACQQFGHIFRRPRGLYVTAADRGRVARVLANWPVPRSGHHRRHRRRAHPRARRPGHQRHGHPDRQARAVHRVRRHRPDPLPADPARRGHEQQAMPTIRATSA